MRNRRLTLSGLLTPNAVGEQIWIYGFSLTGSGSVIPQTMIKGGRITDSLPGQQSWGNLAVSPAGTKLALAADNIDRLPALNTAYSGKVIVIDLRTGQRTHWQGGLDRTGKQFSIQDLSWSADGRSLIFLGQWCDPPEQALGCPGGSDLIVTVLSDRLANGNWRVLTVEDVSAATGAVRHVDYGLSVPRGQSRLPQQVWLAADPSGQHPLISYAVDGGFIIGWIGQGALHRLPILQPYLPGNATLIIAW